MKKVILINPPLYFSGGNPQSLDISMPPLGLLYLASYINKYSKILKAQVLDVGNSKTTLDDLINQVSKTNPFAIGITSMTPQLQGAVEIAQSLKKRLPHIPIFIGGPHISADPDFINRNPGLFDYAITGEAEITFLKSLQKLLKNLSLSRVQKSTPAQDLDKLSVDRSLINRSSYNLNESMLYSRGCPFSCYYCSRPSISKFVRYRSVKNLISEIKITSPYNHGHISFQDDTFTMKSQPIIDFCQAVISQNLKLHWDCNTRIDLVNEKLLSLMKTAGCYKINFGIESGNERVRQNIIHKGSFTNQDIQKVFNWCNNIGIDIACYFMIGHPTETKSEIKDTKNMILKSKIDVLGLSIPIPFPGSPLYDIAKKNGLISEIIIDDYAHKRLGVGYAGIYPVYTPSKKMTKYVYDIVKDINRHFYFRPKQVMKNLIEDLHHPSKFYTDFIDFINLLFIGMSGRKPYKSNNL